MTITYYTDNRADEVDLWGTEEFINRARTVLANIINESVPGR